MQRQYKQVRHLILVLGDQLNADSSAFDGFDPNLDAVWMAEVHEESTVVWSHKARITLFLSAMRHFREELLARSIPVHYRYLEATDNRRGLHQELILTAGLLRPKRLILTQPGEWRVLESLREAAHTLNIPLEIREDRHFLSTLGDFSEFLRGRKQPRLEYFYRYMRRRNRVLMVGDEPAGGKWNYDSANRGSFPREGPGFIAAPQDFEPDAITRQVMQLVEEQFGSHPGRLEGFDWPVSRDQALSALDDFITNRLSHFGEYQDAMWSGQHYLYHSRLSAALNLKLLDPREVIQRAVVVFEQGACSLFSAEGFIRQILGWREYVRGIYWHFMPEYLDRNHFDSRYPLPSFYWTADTEMMCLRSCLEQTLEKGYAHHIQRLMVTGLYALLLGIHPRRVHEWYLAVYVDAVEWVELPNSLGMSQYADGGLMGSKPYIATGKYIQRMSNYCAGCRYKPAETLGDNACPITTLYWDFLIRHGQRLAKNPRMVMQVRNVERLSTPEREAIQRQARRHRLEVLPNLEA